MFCPLKTNLKYLKTLYVLMFYLLFYFLNNVMRNLFHGNIGFVSYVGQNYDKREDKAKNLGEKAR